MSHIDHTHDAAALSWVASANDPATDFPLQNLPFCSFRSKGTLEPWRVGVGIGDQILDLSTWGIADLNALMARPASERRALRHRLFDTLKAGARYDLHVLAGDPEGAEDIAEILV